MLWGKYAWIHYGECMWTGALAGPCDEDCFRLRDSIYEISLTTKLITS